MERDEDNSTLTLDVLDEDPMQDIHAHSVTYRIAMGPQRGRKVFTLQTIPAKPDPPSGSDRVAKLAGFSLHAGVAGQFAPVLDHPTFCLSLWFCCNHHRQYLQKVSLIQLTVPLQSASLYLSTVKIQLNAV